MQQLLKFFPCLHAAGASNPPYRVRRWTYTMRNCGRESPRLLLRKIHPPFRQGGLSCPTGCGGLAAHRNHLPA